MQMRIVAAALVGGVLLVGCGGAAESGSPAALATTTTPTTSAVASTTTGAQTTARPPVSSSPSAAAPLTGDALFSRRLATLGIDTEGKDYLYIPAAHADCDALTQTTLPDDQKFSKIVELSMKLGKFANRRSAEDFMKASIEAYCPQFQRLVPQ